MTKIQSSYRVIKSINVNTESEKSAILTKINSTHNKEFLSQISVGASNEEGQVDFVDTQAISQDIRQQIVEEIKEEMQEERANIIRIAGIEAENLKAESIKQGQEIGLKQGYEQGYQQGYNEGLDQSKLETAEIRKNAIDMVKQAEKNIVDYFKSNKLNVINLAVEIAESIIHYTIDTSSENILMIINPILQEYGKRGNVTISCHPNNMEYLKSHLHQLEEEYPESKFILFEDGNLEKNGCIVENKTQVIDLQIYKQLDSIFEDIKEI